MRDDFNAPFDNQNVLDPSKWSMYDNTTAYGRTQFGNPPTLGSDNDTNFLRLSLSNYNYNADPDYPFKGIEMFSAPFSRGIGKEFEARARVTNLPPGLIAAFWAYGSRGTWQTPDFRSDEIDIELLSKQPHNSLLLTNWNDWNPQNPTYNDGIHHSSQAVNAAGVDWTQWNTYKIRWLPDRTEWYVNNTLVLTMAAAHPDDPLTVRFNVWAPASDWPEAYSSNLTATTNSSLASSYNFDVDWVEVRSVVPTLSLDITPNTFSEAAGSSAATGTVTRNTDITAPLTVNLTSSNTAGATVATQVVIPAGATSIPFSIAAVDNFVVDGTKTSTLTASADQFVSATSPVTITDNDVAGIVVNPTSGLKTTEGGGTATFTVKLTSQPTADVTIPLQSSNPAEGIVNPANLTFTAANWNNPQTVTVSGVNDNVADGNKTYQIITAPATSADANYNNLDAADVSVVNQDDDVAGIIVNPTAGLITTEAGGTATFTVKLSSQPTANVTLGLASSNVAEGTVFPASLTFTANNWSVPQTVTVTGVDDFVVDGNQPYTIITAPAVSADSNYNGLNPADVAVRNTDNDSAGITVTPTSGLVTTEAGGSANFTVRLNSQPIASVSVGLSSSNPAEGVVIPSTLTFNASNWNIPQTVTAVGVDDAIADGDQPYTIITASALSGDANYNGLNPADVALVNRDNDLPVLTLTLNAGSVVEGNAVIGTVMRNTPPTADLAVTLTSSNAAIPVPTGVTIPAGQMAATFNIGTLDDATAQGDRTTIIAAVAGNLADNKVLTVTDNDVPTLTLSIAPTTFAENGQAIATLTRNTPNNTDLLVALGSSDVTAAAVPANVTIPAGSSTASFTVSGVSDHLFDNARPATISASSGSLNALPVMVTVTNSDVPPPPVISTITPGSGPVGTKVTINGSHLIGATVKFGAISAAVDATLSSDNSSVFQVPNTVPVGNATITVTTTNGSVNQAFTVTKLTSFTITGSVKTKTGGAVAGAKVVLLPFKGTAIPNANAVQDAMLDFLTAPTKAKTSSLDAAGTYNFTGLAAGIYAVVPYKVGTAFKTDPASALPYQVETLSTMNAESVNFVVSSGETVKPHVTVTRPTGNAAFTAANLPAAMGSASDSSIVLGVGIALAKINHSSTTSVNLSLYNWSTGSFDAPLTVGVTLDLFKLVKSAEIKAATVAGTTWTATLPHNLPVGNYRVLPFAVDKAFNVGYPLLAATGATATTGNFHINSASGTGKSLSFFKVVLSEANAQFGTSLVHLRFTSPLDAEMASDPAHYSVRVNGHNASVESAGYDANSYRVTLSLPEGGLQTGDKVTVAWNGLSDAQHFMLAEHTEILAIP
ncbi:MAG: family 16 glycosylhydrolase [Abitibacteriaceae bacterium]|nr:family 16 glycosylhydrolase [Abditibacteriaceae bacterium]